jgi:hypothetical protein
MQIIFTDLSGPFMFDVMLNGFYQERAAICLITSSTLSHRITRSSVRSFHDLSKAANEAGWLVVEEPHHLKLVKVETP